MLLINIKKTIIVMLLLVFNFSFSQNGTSKITYKKQRVITTKLIEKDENKRKRINAFEKAQNDVLKNVSFELLCSEYESVFAAEKPLENEGRNRMENLAINLGGGGGILYTNIKEEKQLWEKNAFGQLFLIEKNINDVKWSLINETKIIGDYICFKAISKKRIKNKKGTFYDDVIAWYCPKIPLSFGPMEFCNLPGLILELEVSSMKFYVTEISLNFKNKNVIKKPVKGERVTYEELENIGSGVMSDMKKVMKKKKN